MKNMFIQIISPGGHCTSIWKNEALMEAIKSDSRFCAMGISLDVDCLRYAKRMDAIIISLVSTRDAKSAKNLIEDSYTNPKHFLICETNLFLGKQKLTPSGHPAFKVIPFHRLNNEHVIEIIWMMLNEFSH